MMSIFSCAYLLVCMFTLMKYLLRLFAHLKNWVNLLLSFGVSLYIVDASPLPNM